MTVPDVKLGFPDLFVWTVAGQLESTMSATPDFPSQKFFKRPLRPADPNYSVAVFEADAEPIEYEIGGMGLGSGNAGPSLLRWNCGIQVLAKSGNEEEGRATRSKLLNRVRKTLFSNVCVSTLMTLNDLDTGERVTKYRVRRFSFASGDLNENRQKFYIGQVEIYFETEYH